MTTINITYSTLMWSDNSDGLSLIMSYDHPIWQNTYHCTEGYTYLNFMHLFYPLGKNPTLNSSISWSTASTPITHISQKKLRFHTSSSLKVHNVCMENISCKFICLAKQLLNLYTLCVGIGNSNMVVNATVYNKLCRTHQCNIINYWPELCLLCTYTMRIWHWKSHWKVQPH